MGKGVEASLGGEKTWERRRKILGAHSQEEIQDVFWCHRAVVNEFWRKKSGFGGRGAKDGEREEHGFYM
jgi:hypothetical protein